MDYDPFFPAVGPAYTAAFRQYLHAELKFDVPDEYVVSGGLYKKWDWRHEQPGVEGDKKGKVPVTNVLPDLAVAMTMNPGLHLLVEQGYYDLATPTHALKYNFDVPARGLGATLPGKRRRVYSGYGPVIGTIWLAWTVALL